MFWKRGKELPVANSGNAADFVAAGADTAEDNTEI